MGFNVIKAKLPVGRTGSVGFGQRQEALLPCRAVGHGMLSFLRLRMGNTIC